MKITKQDLICDLQERVMWIGEDEAGNVVAVGASGHLLDEAGNFVSGEARGLLCIVSRATGPAQMLPYEGDWFIEAFFEDQLVTAHDCATGAILDLPGDRRITVPIPTSEFMDSGSVPQTRMLYILGFRDWFSCHVSDQPEVRVHSLGDLPEVPNYERLESSEEGVLICQYGLIISPNEGDPVVFDPVRFPYCKAAFLSNDTVIAALENRVIHTIHTKRGVIDEIAAPRGGIHFLARLGNGAVMLWDDDNPDWGRRKLWGARIGGRECHTVCFGRVDAEAFALDHEKEIVYIGTLQELIRWDVRRGVFDTALMPEQERIVELFWSQSMQRLFIGCRHGEVYALAGDSLD